MQILVHILVLQSILGSFLGGSSAGVEMLQLCAEAHSHFEGVGGRHCHITASAAAAVSSENGYLGR